jgi:transcriptional regulator with XRE-family HTH domain
MQALSVITENPRYVTGMTIGRPTERKRTAFGQRLVAAREALGLSQTELAQRLGLTQRALCWWEREPVALRPEQLAALGDALQVSVDDLLGRAPGKRRAAGPSGKARRAFEAVGSLPRHQQQKVVEVVEALVTQYGSHS